MRSIVRTLACAVWAMPFAFVTSFSWAQLTTVGVIEVNLQTQLITFDDGSGGPPELSQAFSAPTGGPNKCRLALAATDAILMVAAEGGGNAAPGFVTSPDPAWGVRTNAVGVECGQISDSEALRQVLGADISGKVTHTQIVVTVKQSVEAEILQFADGVLTEKILLRSGNSIQCEGTDPSDPTNNTACFTPFDDQVADDNPSGYRVINVGSCPDSCPDNFEDVVQASWSGLWDELVIRTINDGAVSYGPGTSPAGVYTISDVDGQIDCDENNKTVTVPFIDPETSEQIGQSVCRRAENADLSSCEAVPYAFNATCTPDAITGVPICSIDLQYDTELDDPGNTGKFQWFCETWWPAQVGSFTSGSPDPQFTPRIQQFFGPGGGTRGVDAGFCEDAIPIVYDGTGMIGSPPAASPDCDPLDFQIADGTVLSDGTLAGSGTVECADPTVGRVPLIDAYRTVVVPSTLDHCDTSNPAPANLCALPGQQVGCEINTRYQIETKGESCLGSGTCADAVRAIFYHLIFVKGDYVRGAAR